MQEFLGTILLCLVLAAGFSCSKSDDEAKHPSHIEDDSHSPSKAERPDSNAAQLCQMKLHGDESEEVVVVKEGLGGPLVLKPSSLMGTGEHLVITYKVAPGEYSLHKRGESFDGEQRVVILSGEETRNVVFAPRPYAGVRVRQRKGARVPSDFPLHPGDIIRGVDGKRLGHEISFWDYGIQIQEALHRKQGLALMVERASGTVKEVNVNLWADLLINGKLLDYEPTID